MPFVGFGVIGSAKTAVKAVLGRVARHLRFLNLAKIHEELNSGMITSPHQSPPVPEVIKAAVADIQPMGMVAFQPDHHNRATRCFRLTVDAVVHLSIKPLQAGLGIGAQQIKRVLCEIARLIDHDLRTQSAVQMAPHAVRDDRQQSLLIGGAKNTPAILLLVATAKFAGDAPLPLCKGSRFRRNHALISSIVMA